MNLIAFKYGKTEINEKMAFEDGDKNIKLPISLLFFLIETENKKILVDVGCDTMPGFCLYEFENPISILEKYGIKKEEITDIVITHAHHDHFDCLGYYPDAKVYINENESLDVTNRFKNIKNLFAFKKDIEICDNVIAKHIGGHSKGSSVVLIKNNDKTFVLCGDECYTMENFSKGKPTGSSINLEKSTQFINEYRKDAYIPLLMHDPNLVKEIGFKKIF
ncbi:MAG: MBL fold metallo-hydrolase [Ruminococcaceae bacterium]|nr:MBL fold metallo-hydrolase [Oscillospiraceae bacterium]